MVIRVIEAPDVTIDDGVGAAPGRIVIGCADVGAAGPLAAEDGVGGPGGDAAAVEMEEPRDDLLATVFADIPERPGGKDSRAGDAASAGIVCPEFGSGSASQSAEAVTGRWQFACFCLKWAGESAVSLCLVLLTERDQIRSERGPDGG